MSADSASALLDIATRNGFYDQGMAALMRAAMSGGNQAAAIADAVVPLLLRVARPADALAALEHARAAAETHVWLDWWFYKSFEALNRFPEALPHIRRFHQATGQGLWEFLVILAHTASYEEILSVAPPLLERELSPGRPAPGGYQHVALARLSLAHDRAALVERLRSIQATPAWAGTDDVIGAIQAAQRERRALSLIRLGDGEARFFAYMDRDTRSLLSGPERTAMIDSIWTNWFGEPVANADPAMIERLAGALNAAIRSADFLGVPDAHHVASDHYHYGYEAVMLGPMLPPPPHQRLTSAFVHLAIHRAMPFYAGLLRDQDFLGFIGWHPDIAGRLAARFDIARHASHTVPGELGRTALPSSARIRGHFPEAFDAVMDAIDPPHPGALYLVAAGLLGKVYCGRIRERGGIALDIGSLADGWSGLNTRPGYFDRIEEWRLDGSD